MGEINPTIVLALAKLFGEITGLTPPPADQFPPEWFGALNEFYETVKREVSHG